MATHLSARLAWHDYGWNGTVCKAPHLNAHCIIQKHIRKSRDDDKERAFAGRAFAELDGWLPPCAWDSSAYAPRGFHYVHRDPIDFRDLPSVPEEIPPYSSSPAPYRWMLEEFFREVCEAEDLSIRGPDSGRTGVWVSEPDRQRELLKRYWGKLESDQSLIFYYCNHGNPLDESVSRIVVGVGRVVGFGSQLYFGTTPTYQDQYPVWSRRITQGYPEQGVRIPYQEYLHKNLPTDHIICRVPRNAMLPFSYGSEHVSDDVAVAILERIIQCIEHVASDGQIPGDWENRLEWLNNVLAETWYERGPFPGTGSVLQFLGCSKGTAFQHAILAPMAKKGQNSWEYVLAILEGKTDPPKPYTSGLVRAREKWNVLKSRQDLLSMLARFELSADQVQRIANPDTRSASGIDASVEDLIANPYIICENNLGSATSEAVVLETIDHGVRPEQDASLYLSDDKVVHDDRRRIRAIGVEVLKQAAESGDTVLEFSDFINRIGARFPEKRACQPDREIVIAEAAFYRQILWTSFEDGLKLVALKQLQSLEHQTSSVIQRMAKRVNKESEAPIPWLESLISEFGTPNTNKGHQALEEKVKSLQTLFSRRLSVLTGGAGTGKTSVLKVFLEELVRVEGNHSILLLAPTGKARVRLSTRTKRNAMTIHQFLLKQGWFVPDSFALRRELDQSPYPAATVVIDECSMIPTDLFGTMMRALDTGPLSRMILVGDPNQLPPIGPGRPFADIIEWLQSKHPECIAPLSIGMRVEDADESADDSVALTLAEGFRASVVSPGDDEILAAVARGESTGDLEVVFWDDHDDLLLKLKSKMVGNLRIDGSYQSFNASLGISTKEWKRSEDWQILTPTRSQHFGTDDLNRLIQSEYKGGLIAKARNPRSDSPRPFGEREIVWSDKVIQIVNQSAKGWPRETGLDYIANGEIGIVQKANKGSRSDYIDVVFSTQDNVSYRYLRPHVDDSLELAYALTVHKAQGSDFENVFLIIPQKASTLTRELLYTGLTRFRKKLILLVEKDIGPLLRLRNPELSDTRLRNTHMFTLTLRSIDMQRPHLEALIHRTRKGVAVRSKSEVVVADILEGLDISYAYEQPLISRTDPNDFRLPDFTVSFEGDVYYWEHLGMLNVPIYREAWKRKLRWYEENEYSDQLITSSDSPDGGIDAAHIADTARKQILGK